MGNIWDWFCKLSLFIMVVLILNSLIGDLLFKLQYSSPKLISSSAKAINTNNEPIQINLSQPKLIIAKGEKNRYVLQGMAEYSLTGVVVAKNTNFWFRDVMRSRFDDICLMDLGVVWGDLAADKNMLNKHIKFKSTKTLGQARQLQPRCKKNCNEIPWNINYFNSHISHTHLIPANTSVMSALLTIKKWDTVKLDGYLVDIYTDKNEVVARTSLSRSDNNAQGRGYGACEDMYVTNVQINNKIYK